MKKISSILMILAVLLTSCADREPGILELRIGGDIPLGTSSCVVTLTDQDGEETLYEFREEGRNPSFETKAGTYTIGLSFLGEDGEPHVERKINDVKVVSGETHGLTIRLPEKRIPMIPLMALYPSADFTEPDRALEEELEEAGLELTLWYSMTGREEAALLSVLEAFNSSNAYGITVVPVFQGDNNVLHMKAMAALQAGNAPDIIEDRRWRMNEYVPSGKLLELTPYLYDGLGLTVEDYGMLNPMMFSDNRYEGDSIYSTSLGKYAEVLFYNEDFLDENGIEVPETLHALTEASRDASLILGKPSFGVADTSHEGIIGPVCFGASYQEKDGLEFFDGINIGSTYTYYEWWKSGISRKWFRTRGDDRSIAEPFLRGDIAFFTGPSDLAWQMSDKTFEVGVAPVPLGNTPAVYCDGPVFGGFSKDDPLRDLAVSIVLEWFYSIDCGEIWSAFTGAIPSNLGAMEGALEAATGLIGEILDTVSEYGVTSLIFPPVTQDRHLIEKALAIPVEGAESTDGSIDRLIDMALVELRKL